MLFVSVLIFIFPDKVMGIFITEASVIEVGVPMLRVVTPGLIMASFMMGYGSVFSGSGYNIPFLVSSIAGRWGAQIPMLFLAVTIFKLPVIWVWISFLASDLVGCWLLLLPTKGVSGRP